MRVILTSIGHAGDVFPFIAFARALKHRGHQATLLLSPRFHHTATALGLHFHPLREPPGTRAHSKTNGLHRRGVGMLRLWNDVVLPNVPILVESLSVICANESPDWVIYHPASIGAPWICRHNGIRCAAATLIPKAWLEYNRGEVHGVASPGETFVAHRIRRFLQRTRPLVRYFSDRALNRFRSRFGFTPLRDVFYHQFQDGDLNLGLWSPVMRGPLPSDPLSSNICGFTWFDGQDDRSSGNEELGNFLADGPPPIVFTLGTGIVSVAGNFYNMAAEACWRLGRRGLLLTGSARNTPRRLPSGVRAFDYVPLSQVLPYGCLTVHHGGIGTTGQALRAGKPMLIVPFVRDQFDNADLTRRLGTSLTLDCRRITPRALAANLKRLLDHPAASERAASIGRRINQEDGAARAAELLETNSE